MVESRDGPIPAHFDYLKGRERVNRKLYGGNRDGMIVGIRIEIREKKKGLRRFITVRSFLPRSCHEFDNSSNSSKYSWKQFLVEQLDQFFSSLDNVRKDRVHKNS